MTLLGPSGCGKSTLLRALAGLTPVDGGQVRVAGEDITWQEPQKRGIGMVFQSYALFPNMTVRDNVAFGLKMKPQPGRDLAASVQEALELVELTGFERRYPVPSSPAASASGWRWPGLWWCSRGSCCWTSRSRRWMPASAAACASRSARSSSALSSPPSSSPTIRRRR